MTENHELEENKSESSTNEESHQKLSAEGEELSQAISKVAEQAKEKAGVAAEKAKELTSKAGEKVSELMTKENLEKASTTVQQAVEKVESYNKNQLFDKITFGVSFIGECFFVYFFWVVLQLSNISSSSLQALGDGLRGLQNANQAVSFVGNFIFVLVVIAIYNTYVSVKAKKSWASNVNVTIYMTLITTLVGNFLAREALGALSVAATAVNGNIANLFSLASMNIVAIRSGSTILLVFYAIAALANTATLYFLYKKLFAKKNA